MASDGARTWRGQTLRDRTRDRREQLLDVGEELLGTAGAPAVTMRAVCRAATLSPRYFYESFPSREALLVAVYNRVEQRLLDRIVTEQVRHSDSTVRSVLTVCADYFEQDPRRARILLREPLGDDTLRRHSASRSAGFIKAVLPLIAVPYAPASPDELAVVATALSGALVALYLDWSDGRLDISREQLADSAVQVVAALATVGRSGIS